MPEVCGYTFFSRHLSKVNGWKRKTIATTVDSYHVHLCASIETCHKFNQVEKNCANDINLT